MQFLGTRLATDYQSLTRSGSASIAAQISSAEIPASTKVFVTVAALAQKYSLFHYTSTSLDNPHPGQRKCPTPHEKPCGLMWPRNVLRIFALQVGFVFEKLRHVLLGIVLVLQATLLRDHLQSHLRDIGWTWAAAQQLRTGWTLTWTILRHPISSYVIIPCQLLWPIGWPLSSLRV